MLRRTWIVLLGIVLAVLACRNDPEETAVPVDPTAPSEPVSMDLDQVPYPVLSQYNFFTGSMAAQQPNTGVLP